ncbi:metalloregulator ArsR/SmtB family transcription factor [Marinagarivorans algicola]|uniref:metalloregulator ArsR/SmtB family transcription factor n=1 Tax=Marinagarivorans algicola TaxID=1513270 RepID=UPI0006B697B0
MIEPVQLFKCLSDETRLHATLLIAMEGELCVCELMEALGDSQPKISRHLALLRNCGILDDARRGQWVFYSLAKQLPPWVQKILDTTCKANHEALQVFRERLKAMSVRPQCC